MADKLKLLTCSYTFEVTENNREAVMAKLSVPTLTIDGRKLRIRRISAIVWNHMEKKGAVTIHCVPFVEPKAAARAAEGAKHG